ncbi:peptide-methionine (S)-S-oxide reductase, partial [Candidatus Marinamargulisbacteria bacterium SCGC AG-343-K17]
MTDNHLDQNPNQNSNVISVYFAGGCFWCMEPVFDVIEGVTDTTVGYMGGKEDTANYKAVSSGSTKHYEAVRVTYDPSLVSYKTLLDAFWR